MKFFSGKLAIFTSILLSLIAVLPTMDTSDRIYLLPDDPRGVSGESLQMSCSISSTSGIKSSDLELLIRAKGQLFPVDPRFVHIVNETTVELNYLDLPVIFNNAVVICRLNSSRVNQTEATEIAPHDYQILKVGYRPFKPHISTDYKVYNWDYFVFSWSINETDPVYLTKYEAWYNTTETLDYTSCSAGNQRAKQNGNTCKIAKVLDLVHPSGYLWFKVTGSNAVGEVASNTERCDLHNRIQPGRVKNVSVSSTVSNGVVAEFYSPTNEHTRLKYRISVSCGNTTLPMIMIEDITSSSSKRPIRWKIQHVLPPFTKCHLSVSCLPFHNRQYWSDWTENVSFTSPDGFPLVGPQLCCFEVESLNQGQRGIKIYYKNLTERQAQGEVVAYRVHLNILTSGSQMNFTGAVEKNVEANKLFFSLNVDTEKSYTLSVSAQTRAGWNRSAVSFMPLLIQDENLPLLQNMTAIWYGSRIVTVSWLPLEEKLFYTVVWCKGLNSQCKKPVDWEMTSDDSYDIQLPADETHLGYRVGIVVSRVGGRSSGIQWLPCIYNISAVASAPNVRMLNKTSSAVSLHIDEPACSGGNNGYIYEYNVYYLKDGKNVSFIRNPLELKGAEWNMVIDQLEPDFNYSFHAVALTYSGPSEEKVRNIKTDQSGELKHWQVALISLGALLALFFVVFGIFSCCRWNKKQLLRFKKWLNMDITIPRQQTLDNRGPADGEQLASSYTSLTKNLEPLLLFSNTLHSEQLKNSPYVEDEIKGVFTANTGSSSVMQDTRPVTEGDSASLSPTVKNSSGPIEIAKDSCNSIVSNPNLDQSRIISVNRSTNSARSQSSSALEKSIRMSAHKKSIPKDTVVVLSNSMNRTVLASTEETQNEQNDGPAVILHNSMHTSDAGNLGNVATSLSNHHLDESDEVEDYSNVRIADPLGHDIESSDEIYEDGYSLARPSAADDEITEEESDYNYSSATLLDEALEQLAGTEAQPVMSLMDNSNHNESAEDEEAEEDSDNYYSCNYSTASIIRRLQ